MKYTVLVLIGIFATACISTDKRSCCRIGISTQVDERVQYWKRECEKKGGKILSDTILKVFYSKKEAQNYETCKAKKQNCKASEGGSGPQKAKWKVYRLHMTGCC